MEQTKERILQAALALFSKKGFDAVSVAEIADAVGIKAPSLYKHYQSKQEIFQAIIEEMQNRYATYAKQHEMNGVDAQQDRLLFSHIDEDTLVNMGLQMFDYFLHDDFQREFRKLMKIEQFHHPLLAQQYMKQYFDDVLAYQSSIFGYLISQHNFQEADATACALHFYGPIFLLLTLCDCQPQREQEATCLLSAHIRQFSSLYQARSQASI